MRLLAIPAQDRGLIDEDEYKAQKAKVLDIAAEMSRPATSMSLSLGPNVPMTTNQVRKRASVCSSLGGSTSWSARSTPCPSPCSLTHA
jgi:hypothetical protein